MESVLQDVTFGTLTVRHAALEHNVPKSTLHDRLSGKVLPGAVGGAPRYLDDEEEEELVWWLEGGAEVGCAKSVREVRVIVGAIVARKENLDPQLRLRAGETLAYVRGVCTNHDILDQYFDLLEDILTKNALKDKPGYRFNPDKSAIPLQHRPGRRIVVQAQKQSLLGIKHTLLSWRVFRLRGMHYPPWSWSDLFYEWFHQHFLEYALSVRHLLLLLDEYSLHYIPEFIRKACESGVIVFCLPPHTTHLCQPLDVTCFHSLKAYRDNACDQYMSSNPGRVVTIYQFSQLLPIAWTQAMTPQTIMLGFKVTGGVCSVSIYSNNRKAFSADSVRIISSTQSAFTQSAFIFQVWW